MSQLRTPQGKGNSSSSSIRKTSRTGLIRVSSDHMTIPQLITVIKSGWGEGTRTGTEAQGWNGGKGVAPVRGEVKEVRGSPGRATSHCLLKQWLQHTPPSVLNKMTCVDGTGGTFENIQYRKQFPSCLWGSGGLKICHFPKKCTLTQNFPKRTTQNESMHSFM